MPVCEICGRTFEREFGGGMLTGSGTVFKCSDCAAKGLDSTPRAKYEADRDAAEFAHELKMLTPARPLVTWALVAACAAVFALELAKGAGFDTVTPTLAIQLGANYGPLTLAGQWWRLLTAMFLHFGFIHFAFNMWCLWALGSLAERLMGQVAFLVLYFATGLAGGLLGLDAHPEVVSAGASGAVFGITGGLVTYLWLKKAPIDLAKVKAELSSLGVFLAYNLFYSLRPGVDMMAHVGGLFTGLAVGATLPRFLEPADAAAIPSPVREHGPRRMRVAGVGIVSAAVLLVGAAAIRHRNQATAHNELGIALAEKGETDAAIAEFREAVRLDPNDAMAHNNLGAALADKGDYDGAIDQSRTALRLEPNLVLAHDMLGRALWSKGDHDGGIAEFRTAVRLQPSFVPGHVNLAILLADKGDYDGAIDSAHTALRLDPNNSEAHYQLGFALGAKNDLDAAIAELREAVRLRPEDADSHYFLGVALEAKGDVRAALEQYRLARQFGRDDEKFREAFEKLSRKLKSR